MVCELMRIVWSVVETSSLVAAASHLSLVSEGLASLSLSGAWAARRGGCAKRKNVTTITQRINRALIRLPPVQCTCWEKAARLRGLRPALQVSETAGLYVGGAVESKGEGWEFVGRRLRGWT